MHQPDGHMYVYFLLEMLQSYFKNLKSAILFYTNKKINDMIKKLRSDFFYEGCEF